MPLKREKREEKFVKPSTFEIFDGGNKESLASPAARKEHHLGEFGERRRTVAYPLISARSTRTPSAILVALRGVTSWTAWGPYESVTPVATMPKGSHGASYARPGERETGGKIKERVREREKERGRNLRRTSRGRTGREGEMEKGRNIRGGTKTTGIQGQPASFLRDVLTLERTALRPPLSLFLS